MTVNLDNEVFALRDNERIQLSETRPFHGRWIAVMARTVAMPNGPHSAARASDGAPVEQAAIIACEIGHWAKAWHWLQISPPSKERIGDLLFDNGAYKDQWYYLSISDCNSSPDESGE